MINKNIERHYFANNLLSELLLDTNKKYNINYLSNKITKLYYNKHHNFKYSIIMLIINNSKDNKGEIDISKIKINLLLYIQNKNNCVPRYLDSGYTIKSITI